MMTPPEGTAMRHGAGVAYSRDDRVASDGRVVSQAVLSLCVYSTVCGAMAIGLGELAAVLSGAALPASWVRLGTAGAVVVAAGLNTERVVKRVESRLGLLPLDSGGGDARWMISK
jgi:hypothetical protein